MVVAEKFSFKRERLAMETKNSFKQATTARTARLIFWQGAAPSTYILHGLCGLPWSYCRTFYLAFCFIFVFFDIFGIIKCLQTLLLLSVSDHARYRLSTCSPLDFGQLPRWRGVVMFLDHPDFHARLSTIRTSLNATAVLP